ncbi:MULTISPECIES: type VII secretion target [Actinopolyspora]|uniref:Excreted virulence factor EspC, type VII ESX diderm n=1 Tax=Actinopolyspora saharensis TaxID=995062 RepID=A0A1H1EB25_9ACTN|nr:MULTISPECIES: type VII secretion target [Actinopolyspora]NHD19008.1 ESX-1 secretion-associated protein [Actinopolyspora sp. BKK2]NHE78207.1 ESX-1 secretion-associated protein [Actinopolyspora sp. BKK1]SDQ85814.1 Excreted virulence factor EspC, type VII ESX diderm [Actinopolyspora saharensis]
MGKDGFGVNTDEVRAHAKRLQGVTDQIGTAQDAAGQVSLNGSDAYGVLCSPILTPLIGAIEVQAMTAIGTANAAVEATATGLEGAATAYDEVDQQISELLQSVQDKLGEI